MGEKISIYDVAKKVGVSAATVSYVINGRKKVGQETIRKVLDAIKELGYIPNYTARTLSTGKSHLIGILLPLNDASIAFLQNPFYSEFIGGFEKGMVGYSYDIVIGVAKPGQDLVEWIKRRNIDGLVLIGSHNDEIYQTLDMLSKPVVLIDDDGVKSNQFNNIKTNDQLGMYLSTKYLIEQGHRDIGFVGNYELYPIDKRRYDGYVKAMEEANLKVDPNKIYLCDATFDDGIKIADEIIKRKNVTAVVCSADILGIGIIKRYKALGLDIPEDLSIVGFDDIQGANYIYPGLTTIHQDIGEKGEKAAGILMKNLEESISDKTILSLEPYLVKRESVKMI